MIKRYTPNKDSFTPTRASGCCNFSFKSEMKTEKRIEVNRRSVERGQSFNTSTKQLNNSGFQEMHTSNQPFKTPKHTVYSTRNNSFQKETFGTATTVFRTPIIERFIINTGTENMNNPISRLKLRKEHRQTPKTLSKTQTMPKSKIIFQYFAAKSQLFENKENPEIKMNTEKTVVKEGEEQSLINEIAKYRIEYDILLDEFERLKKQKVDNCEHYKRLLERLKEKEEQIRVLEQFRKEELAVLKQQLQIFSGLKQETE